MVLLSPGIFFENNIYYVFFQIIKVMHVSYGKCRRLQRKWEVLIFPLWWDLPPKFSSDFPVCFLVTYRSIYLVFLMKLLSYPEVLGFYKTCRTNYSKSLAQSLECDSCSINMLTEWKGEPWFFDSIRLVEDLTVRLCLNLLIFMFYLWSKKHQWLNPPCLSKLL